MTTGAEEMPNSLARDESGQSLLEFLLLLPMLMGSAMILIRLNTAIQMSIVDQKYARAQTLFLPHNSAIFPKIARQNDMFSKGTNQMVLGVSDDNTAVASDGDGTVSATYHPTASTYRITRNVSSAGPDGPAQEEPASRGRVRIRNTISLCTHTIAMKSASGSALAQFDGDVKEVNDAKAFLYCASKLTGLETLKP